MSSYSSTHMHPPDVGVMDAVGPMLAAGVLIAVMSLVREPVRHTLNAVLVAGSAGVYISGGLGVLELVYPLLVTPILYLGLRSYRFIAIAWLMHSTWDVVHHLWGNPIWPFMPTSSFGCTIFDAAIAMWFFAGAPSVGRLRTETPAATTTSLRELPLAGSDPREATSRSR
jgi:hypothetical protein